MVLPLDYAERVYAGVLGKIIGVYLGRPFEGWSYERIMQELGEINYYVHEKRGVPLIVTDDDISGTFTFLRALPDYGNSLELTPRQIGQTWLNYLIENRTVLWWGGLGNSTEHTAYLRLKHGISAPSSGSIETNGKVVAEQIGAQIFIDGWAMVSPGDPERAAVLAKRAASVSHDGEAIYGAQVLAAMEALAFVESDIQKLINVGVSMIPEDSIIYRLIADLREWHAEMRDWRDARQKVVEFYGYDKYGGNCHMVPNHGLIILGLLYGEDNFQKTLMITNTSGWDTDCNSGNIGCLMGIKNGLSGLDVGPDWRSPVKDKLFLPTADGGSCITDAVTESIKIINIGRSLAKLPPLQPKDGARFHFEFPGSVQGFEVINTSDEKNPFKLMNVLCKNQNGERCLAVEFESREQQWHGQFGVATFVPPEALNMPGYSLFASPTIYPGQVIHAEITADLPFSKSVQCLGFLNYYGENDILCTVYGPEKVLRFKDDWQFTWELDQQLPIPKGAPIARIGFELRCTEIVSGTIYLNRLTWDGIPDVILTAPSYQGSGWRKAWVDGVDSFQSWVEPFRLIQNEGTGLIIQGVRDWKNYKISADVTPHMVQSSGIAACVQGMKRYYALLLVRGNTLRLVKVVDGEKILGEVDFPWNFGEEHHLGIGIQDNRIKCWADSSLVFDMVDDDQPLLSGAIALIVKEGRSSTRQVIVEPN